MTITRTVRHALRVVCAGAAICLVPASSALAATSVSSIDQCAIPTLTQQFTSIGDDNLYTLAPGGDFSSADDGWQLSGGASIVQTAQADGTIGGVLDLPSKAHAVSPVMCITSAYPTSRLNVRNIKGSEGVFFYVSYLTANGTWTNPKNTGQFHGNTNGAWSLSNPMNVQPSSTSGWQLVRFTFISGGTTSRFQVDNFWVDPRMRA